MANKWFVSDTHFCHENILKFTGDDGQLIRPGFASVEDMNERMVNNWNSVVRPGDKVYHLGDVAFKTQEKNAELMKLLSRLSGSKTLILGNHDKGKDPLLLHHFQNIVLWKGFGEGGFTCSHIPLRLDSLRDGRVNVHGHIHQNLIDDPHYINLCVEHCNYTPVHYDQIVQTIKDRGV